MRVSLLVLAAVLCVLLLSSCGGGGNTTFSFTPADFGTTKTVGLHQAVILELPENPSTGCSWHQSWAPQAALQLTQDEYQSASATVPPITGGGGTRRFVYETQQPGQAVITVQYGQWWENGGREDPQTITLRII